MEGKNSTKNLFHRWLIFLCMSYRVSSFVKVWLVVVCVSGCVYRSLPSFLAFHWVCLVNVLLSVFSEPSYFLLNVDSQIQMEQVSMYFWWIYVAFQLCWGRMDGWPRCVTNGDRWIRTCLSEHVKLVIFVKLLFLFISRLSTHVNISVTFLHFKEN